MARWDWLTQAKELYNQRFVVRVVVKALLLFVIINVVFGVFDPLPMINRTTIYNTLLPGRERLPYSDNPQEAFNLSLSSIDGMFSSHIISGAEPQQDEYRVALIGDSSVWGVLLDNDSTLSGCLNQVEHYTADGRRLVVYNLGYPVLSVFKDTLILDRALNYDLDAVVWFTTLQALFQNEQLRHPIVADNAELARDFIAKHDLDLDTSQLSETNWWDDTLIGRRRELSNWLRFNMYGLAWWMTGQDYAPAQFLGAPVRNLPDSESVLNQPQITLDSLAEQQVLAWDVLDTGMALADAEGVPVLLVNEPIYISDGLNSDKRYNEYYPRWAYDEYRATLATHAQQNEWPYADLWDFVPAHAFTDTPFHYTEDHACAVADQIVSQIVALTLD